MNKRRVAITKDRILLSFILNPKYKLKASILRRKKNADRRTDVPFKPDKSMEVNQLVLGTR